MPIIGEAMPPVIVSMTDRPHIVLVDDDHDILELARLSLENIGQFRVTTYAQAREFVAAASDLKADLVVLDLMMPDMDGLETLGRLRQSRADLKVIFLTGKAQDHVREKLIREGAAGVINKPFSPMVLPGMIEDYLD